MYQVHINGKPVSEHGSKEDAIFSLTENYRLDMLHQIELNSNMITYLGKACITLTQIIHV